MPFISRSKGIKDLGYKEKPNNKYNEETVNKIITALLGSNRRSVAARAAGLDPRTFDAWMEKYPDFKGAVEEAEAAAEMGIVEALQRRAITGRGGDVVAIKYLLGKRFGDIWNDTDGSTVKIEIADPIEELERKYQQSLDVREIPALAEISFGSGEDLASEGLVVDSET